MSDDAWPYGRMGDHTRGEIELIAEGLEEPSRWTYRNKYIAVRNDPVVFPGGVRGEYVSIHPGDGVGPDVGVVVLPLFAGKLVLCRNYRHAPRRWELEIPRGFIDRGESPDEAARRELAEEYGVTATLTAIGSITPDSGLLTSDVRCYLGDLDALPLAAGEFDKRPPVLASAKELLSMVAAGEVRDGFLLSATMLAVAKGLLEFA